MAYLGGGMIKPTLDLIDDRAIMFLDLTAEIKRRSAWAHAHPEDVDDMLRQGNRLFAALLAGWEAKLGGT